MGTPAKALSRPQPVRRVSQIMLKGAADAERAADEPSGVPGGGTSGRSGVPIGAKPAVQTRIDLAWRALRSQQFHMALLYLEAAQAIDPAARGLSGAMGQALLGVGLVREALDDLERAVAEDPTDCESWRCLAVVRERRGDYEGAADGVRARGGS